MQDWWNRRWRGQPGRLEVWYATATDRRTGTGLWIHGENVAPSGGGAPLQVGWAAVFPADGPPVWAHSSLRERIDADRLPRDGYRDAAMQLGPDGTSGTAGDGELLRWSLAWDSSHQRGLATFPEWAWDRQLLPAAQVVPAPSMSVQGVLEWDDRRLELDGTAQAARIYGHGNAEQWGWLHAELGNGDVVELVSAVSTRPGLRSLPPITFLAMRVGGADLPAVPVAAFGLRAKLGLPGWTVSGRVRGLSVRIEVHQPLERCVTLPYADPDGRDAWCCNTERADLSISVRTRSGAVRRWLLEGTAHAEIGGRGSPPGG